MPQRCAYWHSTRTLITADLHLGKCETFRAHGLGLPGKVAEGVLEEQLTRLELALNVTGAERLIVVGDLLHAPLGIVPAMVDRVRAWREQNAQAAVLIAGNHDRLIDRVSDAWRVDVVREPRQEGPFAFVHNPDHVEDDAPCFVWCGHVHPTVRLSSGVDSVKLPCFIVSDRMAVLPAFSCFTSGFSMRPSRRERLYAIVDDSIMIV